MTAIERADLSRPLGQYDEGYYEFSAWTGKIGN